MRNTLSLLAILCLCSITKQLFAQDKSPVKFGKIAPDDFKVTGPLFDSSAKAVIIADIGESEFQGNPKGSFSILFKRFSRVIIMDQKGIDAATVEIPMYTSGSRTEMVDGLKAHTYNLEGGKVVDTKLDGSAVFTEKRTKNLSIMKFTLPAVKPGSIIEYTYTLKSDFLFNLQGWEFQGEYPRLWSEYSTGVPEFFKYIAISQIRRPFDINTEVQSTSAWDVVIGGNSTSASEHVSLKGNIAEHRWVMKNVPAFKEEPFTSTPENHIAKLEFQLNAIQWPESPLQLVMSSWEKVAEELMNDDEFGGHIKRANNWLDDDMKVITKGAKTNQEKIQLIYEYVREHVTCTGSKGLYTHDDLSKVWKMKQGNVAEVNLLLVTMFVHENITAHPVILSTKSHGYVNVNYPIMDKYNYVICYVTADNKEYLLDATRKQMGFGQLHWSLYNGQARIIDPKDPSPINLSADSIHDASLTIVNLEGAPGGNWSETVKSTLGTFGSYDLREQLSEKDGVANYVKKKQADFGSDAVVTDLTIDSLKSLSDPVTVHYSVKYKSSSEEDLIYLNPLLGESIKANPFHSDKREYPVEMPFDIDENVIVYVTIPEGYTIDEMPKSAKVNFYETDGGFECLYFKANGGFQMKYRFHFNVANFPADSYEDLRSFYGAVIKKISEPVVLKKVK